MCKCLGVKGTDSTTHLEIHKKKQDRMMDRHVINPI